LGSQLGERAPELAAMRAGACQPRHRAVPLVLAGLVARAAAAPSERSAAEYLSEEPFPGLHVLERVGDGPQLLLHRQGQRPEAAGREPAMVDTSRWASWAEARRDLERQLAIPEREPLQSEWAVFNAQGRPIKDLTSIRDLSVAFVLEIGQWMWPAVRVGFEHTADGVNRDSPAILRTLSLRPVVFEVRDFITKSEAHEVMEIGGQQGLHHSEGVLQSEDIKQRVQHAEFRTSEQAWLDNDLAPLIAELDERVANLTRVPASHNEAVQLLRYNEGTYYHGHMDWTELELYPDQRDVWLESHFGYQDRLATVFWYLNDVDEGGETVFPKHGQPICKIEERGGPHTMHCAGAHDPDMASCDHGLKVTPRQGTVVLWYNFHPSGRGDRNSLHAGCPVGKNATKWSANKWVRIKEASSQGRWVDGHPALERHGWVDGRGTTRPELKECVIAFANSADSSADLMWLDPFSGSYKTVTTIQAGATSSTNSFHGHIFQLRSGPQRSKKVKCRWPRTSLRISGDLRLTRLRDASEL